MSKDTRTPAKKAMDYIEFLGVHSVYREAISSRDQLDKVFTDLAALRDKRRALEAQKSDREMELLGEETAKHADMSVAALERHLKSVYHNDTILNEIRIELRSLTDDLDGLEFDRSYLETDVKIAVARLSELGGLLQFMAVVKNEASKASDSSDSSKASDPDPWRIT